jgi:mono/diheme cytochrome c family protein
MKLLTTSLFAALLLATPALAQQGNADNGKKLFLGIGCYQCHGNAGQGAAMTGPRVSNTQLPMEGFLHQLREPLNQMPPYEAAVLSDKDAADIYAYIKSMPAPPDPKSLPLLMSMGSR